MSTIRKYKDFKINEELFGLTKAEKIDRRIRNIQDSLDRYLAPWIKKKSINVPNKADLDKFWDDAKKDDYMSGDIVGGPGALGISASKNIMYRKYSDIKTKGPSLEGISENSEFDEDENGMIFSRDNMIEILSSDYSEEDLNGMSDSEIQDLWDKMEMDSWLDDQD